MRLRLLIVVVIAAISGVGRSASANVGRAIHANVAGGFAILILNQRVNETWTVTTSNLSSGGDTVMHVQYSDGVNRGRFIAGNDDYVAGSLASRVVVAPTSVARNLLVIVRSYSEDTTGTCTVTATSSLGASSGIPLTSFGGTAYFAGTLPVGSHITTAREQQPGGDDTVLLAFTGQDPSHAAFYDDDSGVDFMSFIRLPETCTTCNIVIGNYDSSFSTTTLVWDSDAETNDSDLDGLSNSLESIIGTSSTNIDSDADGIRDDYELFGVEVAGKPSLLFPFMGADPTKKDLFIEADWLACPGCTGIDDNRVQPSDAMTWAADFLPVRVHMDIGLPNTDPNTWFTWGDWGGSERQDTYADPYCGGFSAERMNFFHHFIADGLAGSSHVGFPCSAGNRYDRQGAHELGHQLFLEHGGRAAVGDFNNKPQYRSMMNYAYEFDGNVASFSHGDLPVGNLNWSALDEHAGLGTTDSGVLGALANTGPWAFKVDTTNGYVDWDRDGEFSPAGTTVRASIAANPQTTITSTVGYTSFAPSETFTDPALVWQSVGGSVGDRLMLFGRGANSKLEYLIIPRSNLDNGCSSFTSIEESAATNCAGLDSTVRKAGPTNGPLFSAPAVADLGGGKLLVVYGDALATPHSYILTTNPTTGQDSWSADTTLPGVQQLNGNMTALPVAGGVWVFGQTLQGLKKWFYSNGVWGSPTTELWSDGTPVDSRFGVAATMGYQDGVSFYFIAVAVTSSSPPNQIEFAKFVSGRWIKMTDSWPTFRAVTTSTPYLVFEHTAGQAASVGRFYLGWTPPGSLSLQTMTEGSLSAATHSTKRLIWVSPVLGSAPFVRGASAAFAPGWDKSFHYAFSYVDGNGATVGAFAPIGDGIPNFVTKDLNDYDYLQGALRASLGYETLPLP